MGPWEAAQSPSYLTFLLENRNNENGGSYVGLQRRVTVTHVPDAGLTPTVQPHGTVIHMNVPGALRVEVGVCVGAKLEHPGADFPN